MSFHHKEENRSYLIKSFSNTDHVLMAWHHCVQHKKRIQSLRSAYHSIQNVKAEELNFDNNAII